MADERPDLRSLRLKLEGEEAAYAELLAALDRMASLRLTQENRPDLHALAERLRALAPPLPPPPAGRGLKGRLHRAVWGLLSPHLARHEERHALLL
ncbi:MAG TPA: hypothetical protein VFO85_09515, partial [Vicinamibacteria bacterium]|nr:hypothetical protein [Vicinamibacteria bacterium]